MFRFTTSLLLSLAWLTGCSAPPRSGANPAILAQWSGPQSGINQPSSRIIRDAADWTALWQLLHREPPQGLGKNQIAVAVFLGQRRSGGFRVEVTDARAEAGEIVVEFREHTPAPGMMTTQALTSPWTVVTLPASPQTVVVRSAPAAPSAAK